MHLFKQLNRFERVIWLTSVAAIVISFVLCGVKDILTLIASLIGVTALIFVAKGYVIGQILTIVFAVFYGVISFFFRYYGEMFTYLGMTAPMALLAAIEWFRNPYQQSAVVKVRRLYARDWLVMVLLNAAVTAVFYVLLRALENANLLVSTISVTTSFAASWFTCLRSPYYALAYAANDLVLIVLWILASLTDPSYIPMVVCFVMFFINDLYGFFNWKRMERFQEKL